eukprot:jgi/Ulvmu1/8808/UM048_0063.1
MVSCSEKRKMADMPSSKLLDSFTAAADEAALVSVLRNYKNQIIGNKHKKAEFQAEGIIPAVIQLASQHEAYAVWQQIAAIVYSMAAGGGPESVQAIQEAHGPDMLLQMLCAEGEGSEQVVLGSARALTALYDHPSVGVAPLLRPQTSQLLTRLAGHSNTDIARYIMHLCGLVSLRAPPPDPSAGRGSAEGLMAALSTQLPRCIFADPATRTGTAAPRFVPLRAAVLSTMDVLLNQHDEPFTMAGVPALPDVTAAIKFPDAETRLAACSVIATMLHPPRIAAARRSPEWPRVREQLNAALVRDGKREGEAEGDGGEDAREARVRKALESVCLSVLVKLQAVPAARTRIPYRLFGIICNSEELQRLVADSDALENLISFIITETESASWATTRKAATGAAGAVRASGDATVAPRPAAVVPRYGSPQQQLLCALLCVVLLCGTARASPPARSALASPCLQTARAAIADAQCVRNCAAAATTANLHAFARCLQHPQPTVRTAAAMVLRVVGRCSEATAKECFGDQQFATTLVATLDDPNPAVRAALCFAVCNLCATASCPARQLLLDKGVVGKLAAITVASEGQETPHLPDASIAALSNTVNNATQAIREELMSQLPWPRVRAMLSGAATQVAASAWSFLQNLSHSSDVAPIQRPVLQWSQGELLSILHDVIRAEVLDKAENGAAPSEDAAAMDATPIAIPASPVSMDGANEQDPDGPAPMVAQDTDPDGGTAAAGAGAPYVPANEAGAYADAAAAAAAREHAQDGVTPASASGLGGIRGTSADVQRDYSDPSVSIQGELRELSDIAGLRSPMGGLLADPERLLQSQSWWTIATAGGAGNPGGLAPEPPRAGDPRAGVPAAAAAPLDADGGQDAARLARQRKVLISALYVANNLATGDDDVKAELLATGLHTLIPAGLRFCCGDDATTFEVNKVSCWLATNIVHPEAPAAAASAAGAAGGSVLPAGLEAAQERAQALVRAGVLAAMQDALQRPGQVGKAELGPRLHSAISRLQSLLGEQSIETF